MVIELTVYSGRIYHLKLETILLDSGISFFKMHMCSLFTPQEEFDIISYCLRLISFSGFELK